MLKMTLASAMFRRAAMVLAMASVGRGESSALMKRTGTCRNVLSKIDAQETEHRVLLHTSSCTPTKGWARIFSDNRESSRYVSSCQNMRNRIGGHVSARRQTGEAHLEHGVDDGLKQAFEQSVAE